MVRQYHIISLIHGEFCKNDFVVEVSIHDDDDDDDDGDQFHRPLLPASN